MDCQLSIHTLQNKNSKYSNEFVRILNDNFPEEKYKPKQKDCDRTTVHYGQRKLFLSEVEFLTNVCIELPLNSFKKIVLIYAGSAPGIHLNFLHEMFPFIKFVLIDPAKMAIEPSENVKIYQEYFDDRMALDLKQDYEDYLRLFISDIRRFGPGAKMTDEEIEKEALEDMNNQMNWYGLLKPFRSLFKFRLPYVENRTNAKTKIDYLEGDVYFQIWPPSSSSETRLYVRENATKKPYDCLKYENQLFRFNNYERTLCYEHNYKLPGLDHCYDCRAEIYVFENYLNSFEKIKNLCSKNQNITKLTVKEYVEKLNQHLDADKKMLTFCYDKKEYKIKFTDISYGISSSQLFNENSLVKTPTYFKDKWSHKSYHFDHSNPNNFRNNNFKSLKDRLQYPNTKRLQNNKPKD